MIVCTPKSEIARPALKVDLVSSRMVHLSKS
jgi:hypothetical protein